MRIVSSIFPLVDYWYECLNGAFIKIHSELSFSIKIKPSTAELCDSRGAVLQSFPRRNGFSKR